MIRSTKEKATGTIRIVRVKLTKKQKTFRPDDKWPDIWKFMSSAAKRKAKQRWAIEKPKLDNTRQLRGIFFIEPNDEEFKLTMKAARRKLEVPTPAAMPCKIPIKSNGETHRYIGKLLKKYVIDVDADDSTRPRLEKAGHKLHQDHITAKGMNSTTFHSLVHKVHSDVVKKFPSADAAVDNEWENFEKIPPWQLRKSETRKKSSKKQEIKSEKFMFRH